MNGRPVEVSEMIVVKNMITYISFMLKKINLFWFRYCNFIKEKRRLIWR